MLNHWFIIFCINMVALIAQEIEFFLWSSMTIKSVLKMSREVYLNINRIILIYVKQNIWSISIVTGPISVTHSVTWWISRSGHPRSLYYNLMDFQRWAPFYSVTWWISRSGHPLSLYYNLMDFQRWAPFYSVTWWISRSGLPFTV